MELYKNTANALVEYLLAHGYPKDRIILEWGNSNYAIDIVILANDYITPISIFEIKGGRTSQSFLMGIEQLRRAVSFLDVNVQCTLVFGTDKEPFFTAYDVTSFVYGASPIQPFFDTIVDSSSYYPVEYNYLASGANSKLCSRKLDKKQKRVDRMKWFCWYIIPPAAIAVLVLDKLNILPLTTERLIIISAIFIIVLLPFFSEISIKDFSMKRDISTKDKK